MHKRFVTRGFTVVELLIVIVVIGILASLSYVGYNAYIKNTQNSKIATTVSAYQAALEGAVFEDDEQPSLGACLAQTPGACCAPTSSTQWVCGDNSSDPAATASYDKIKKYVPSNPPTLPEITNSWPACPTSLTPNTSGPCKMNNVLYWQTVPTPSGPIAGLVYYLPPDYDCNSTNTLKFDSTTFTWSKQDGTAYSRRLPSGTPTFTECVVSLK